MLSFLKVFARGVICTVLLPLILLVWVLYGVYCLITFLVMLIKSIISFFAGDNSKGELKEDIEAKRILLEAEQAKIEQQAVVSMMYQNLAAQQMMQPGMPQSAPQPARFDQPNEIVSEQPAKDDFDPFTPDEVKEEPFDENKGGNDNGQSY